MSRIQNPQRDAPTTSQQRELYKHGPLPSSDDRVGKMDIEDKMAGVATFAPQVGLKNTPVYYLVDEHAAEDILAVWCDANQSTIEATTKRSLHHRISNYGEEFRLASSDRWGQGMTLGGSPSPTRNSGSKTTCGACGEEEVTMRNHLPECDAL